MNTWTKSIIIGILLIVALVGAITATIDTVQAVHTLQQHRVLEKKGDVHIISSWMTISYVSRTYHVPEDYLARALHVPSSPTLKHTTLYVISTRYHRPINEVIHTVQLAIVTYRQQHPLQHTPTAQASRIAVSAGG